MYCIGDYVEIRHGEYAGLGGVITAVFPDGGYEVLVAGYRLPIAMADMAPDLRQAAREALAELHRLHAPPVVIARLIAALS